MRVMIDAALPRHPKVRRLAKALGLSRKHTVGIVVSLWCEVMLTEQSEALDWTADELSEALDWTAGSLRLVSGMLSAGFLDKNEDGTYRIHNWFERQGDLIERRIKDRDRKRKERSVRGQSQDASNPPYPSPPSPSCPNRTEPGRSPEEPPSTLDITKGLFTEPGPPPDSPKLENPPKPREHQGPDEVETFAVNAANEFRQWRGPSPGLEWYVKKIRHSIRIGVPMKEIKIRASDASRSHITAFKEFDELDKIYGGNNLVRKKKALSPKPPDKMNANDILHEVRVNRVIVQQDDVVLPEIHKALERGIRPDILVDAARDDSLRAESYTETLQDLLERQTKKREETGT